MKKHFILLACSILGAALTQAQTQPGPTAPSASQSGVQPQVPQQPGPNRAQSGVPIERDSILDQPAGAPRPDPIPPAATNPILPGPPSPTIVNPTSPVIVDPGGTPVIVDPSGTPNPQAQPGLPGAGTNQAERAADQAFTQSLREATLQPGTRQIFSPQSQSVITVMNQNGVITLQGNVRNEGEKRSIEARLKNMRGVTSINNQLRVSNVQELPPLPALPNPGRDSETERRLLNP